MRDSRASDYDTRDTGNLVGFIERREDTGPDYTQLLTMAQQNALAQQQALEREKAREAMKQANSGTGGQTVNPRALVQSGPQGGAAPMWLGANPVQLAQGMGLMPNLLAGPQAITSNRYPTPRGNGTPSNVPPSLGGLLSILKPKPPKKSNPPGTARKAVARAMIARQADREGNEIYAREQAALARRRAVAAQQKKTNSLSPSFLNAPQAADGPSPNDWMTYYALGNR
jgi:hypothetical protein